MADKLRDFFDSSLSAGSKMREEYFKFENFLEKGRMRLKKRIFGGGKEHYDFDNSGQEFYYEKPDSLFLDKPEVQEFFYEQYFKLFEGDLNDNLAYPDASEHLAALLQKPLKKDYSLERTRRKMVNHLKLRVNSLRTRKFKTVRRVGQHLTDDLLASVGPKLASRIALIDADIAQSLRRIERLQSEEQLEQGVRTIGKRPVPINDQGNPVYKQLEDQESLSTNLDRDDFEVYARAKTSEFQTMRCFLQLRARFQGLGTQLLYQAVAHVNGKVLNAERVRCLELRKRKYRTMSDIFGKASQPHKNAIQIKEKIEAFLTKTFQLLPPPTGVFSLAARYDQPPLVPSFYFQYEELASQCLGFYFRDISISKSSLDSVVLKINHFSSIIFKYQNCERKMGEDNPRDNMPLFEDDIDLDKELCTSLQESFVRNVIKRQKEDWNYYYNLVWHLVPSEWTSAVRFRNHPKGQRFQTSDDPKLRVLINLMDSNNFKMLRSFLKENSQLISARAQRKLMDLRESVQLSASSEVEKSFQHMKRVFSSFEEVAKQSDLGKQLLNCETVFWDTCRKETKVNCSYLEAFYSLYYLRVREHRRKLICFLNGMAAYRKRVTSELMFAQPEQQFDDRLVIDVNKEDRDSFQKRFREALDFSTISGHRPGETSVSEEKSPSKKSRQEGYDQLKQNPLLQKQESVERMQFEGGYQPIVWQEQNGRRKSVLFSCVEDELKAVEDRLCNHCSFYISKFQKYVQERGKPQLCDRMKMLHDYMEAEAELAKQKFQLVELYVLAMEHTIQPAASYSLAEKVFKVCATEPELDPKNHNFASSFITAVSLVREEKKLAAKLFYLQRDREVQATRNFQQRLLEMLRIPLSKQNNIYKDYEQKVRDEARLSRKNSVSSISKISLKSGRSGKGPQQKMVEISEVSGEDVSDLGEEEELLQGYDEYLLSKNMDQLFEDIAKGEELPLQSQKHIPSIAQISNEHLVIHKRFEGGPYPPLRLHSLPKCRLTSSPELVDLFDFHTSTHLVLPLLEALHRSATQLAAESEFLSVTAKQSVKVFLFSRAIALLDQYSAKQTKSFFEDQTAISNEHDLIAVVIKNSQLFKKVAAFCLEPPSVLMHQSTLNRAVEAMTPVQTVLNFDYRFLNQAVKLERPSGLLRYRDVSLYCNALCLLSLHFLWVKTQLERKSCSKIYKRYGSVLGFQRKKYGSMFLKEQLPRLQVDGCLFEDGLRQAKTQVFYQMVLNEGVRQFAKRVDAKARRYYLFAQQLKSMCDPYSLYCYQATKVNVKRVFTDNDNLKRLSSRADSLLANQLSQFRKYSFVKWLGPVRKAADQVKANIAPSVAEVKLPQSIKEQAKHIVRQKLSRECFSHLFMQQALEVLGAVCKLANKIDLMEHLNYLLKLRTSLPMMERVFEYHEAVQSMEKTVLYDQRRIEAPSQRPKLLENGKLVDPFLLLCPDDLQQIPDAHQPCDLQKLEFRDLLSALQQSLKPEKASEQTVEKPLLESGHSFQVDGFKYLLKFKGYFTGSKRAYFSGFLPAQEGLTTKLLRHYKSIVRFLHTSLIHLQVGFENQQLAEVQTLLSHGLRFESLYPAVSDELLYERLRQIETITFRAKDLGPKGLFEQARKKAKDTATSGHTRSLVSQTNSFIQSKTIGYQLLRLYFLPLSEQLNAVRRRLAKQELPALQSYLKVRADNLMRMLYLAISKGAREMADCQDSFSLAHFNLLDVLYHPYSKNRLDLTKVDTSFHSSQAPASRSVFSTRARMCFFRRLKSGNNHFNSLRLALASTPIRLEQCLLKLQENYSSSQQGLNPKFCSKKWLHKYSRPEFVRQGCTDCVQALSEQQRKLVALYLRDIVAELDVYAEFKGVTGGDLLIRNAKQSQYLCKNVEFQFKSNAYLAFKARASFPVEPSFGAQSREFKDMLSAKVICAYDDMERYLQGNRLTLTRQQRELMSGSGPSEGKVGAMREGLGRLVLGLKILREQWFCLVLGQVVRILNNEKALANFELRHQGGEEKAVQQRKTQSKGVFNAGLVPRVRIVPCFSSPLIVERKNYIAGKYRLAFVQAFINRLRNKISRVDLLSSGFGFVVTVTDLEDCINFLNKSLFSFAEKEFKHRIDTYSYLYDLMANSLLAKNRALGEAKAREKVLQNRLAAVSDGLIIRQAGAIMMQNHNLRKQLREIEQSSKGLEERTRKLVQIQYEQKLKVLQNKNRELAQLHRGYKQALTSLTRFQVDINSKALATTLLKKAMEVIGKDKQKDKTVQVKEESKAQINNLYEELLQSHKEAEGDPYRLKTLLGQMRSLCQLRLITQRTKFQSQIKKLEDQIKSLESVHDQNYLAYQSQVEMRSQVHHVQTKITDLRAKNEFYRTKLDQLQAQKSKLQFVNIDARKKIQKHENDLGKLAHLDKIDVQKLLQELKAKNEAVARLQAAQEQSLKKQDQISKSLQAKIKHLEKSLRSERQLAQRRTKKETELPFLQLSERDIHWKDKCFQLHSENVELRRRLQSAKAQQLPSLQKGSVSSQDQSYRLTRRSFLQKS